MDYGLRMMLGGGMFFWIIPLVLLILIIYSAYKAFGPTRNSYNGKDKDPLDTLKDRYARGEITEDEFVKMRERLRE